MKIRHILGTLIVLSFGAAVFLRGWTQWKVGPGQVGIVMSKTSGISNEAVLPGVFSWHWEFLLPTNALLAVFSTGERTVLKEENGTLPGSSLYEGAFTDTKADFSYSISLEFTADLKESDILKMCKNSTITDERSLTEYIERKAQTAADKALPLLLNGAKSLEIESIQEDSLFREVRVVKCIIPDETLYNTMKEQYINRLKAKEERTQKMKQAVTALLAQYPELQGNIALDNLSLEDAAEQTAGREQGNRADSQKERAVEKRVKAIRGAAGVETDDKESVIKCVNEMCGTIFKENELKTEDIVSVIFTVTSDIRSINPATALRTGTGGIVEGVDTSKVPLFCAQEPIADGMAEKIIRVMVTAYMEGNVKTVYINGAQRLRG